MKPFLLYLLSDEEETAAIPALFFDEQLSVNMIRGRMEPLAMSHHLLATQTKTKARRESDDQD